MGGGNLSWGLGICPYAIYKGGGKDRHSLVSYRGIYLLNTLTKLFEGSKHIFLNSQNSMISLPPLSRGQESPAKPVTLFTRLLSPYKSNPNTDSPATALSTTFLLPTHPLTENAWV